MECLKKCISWWRLPIDGFKDFSYCYKSCVWCQTRQKDFFKKKIKLKKIFFEMIIMIYKVFFFFFFQSRTSKGDLTHYGQWITSAWNNDRLIVNIQ